MCKNGEDRSATRRLQANLVKCVKNLFNPLLLLYPHR